MKQYQQIPKHWNLNQNSVSVTNGGTSEKIDPETRFLDLFGQYSDKITEKVQRTREYRKKTPPKNISGTTEPYLEI